MKKVRPSIAVCAVLILTWIAYMSYMVFWAPRFDKDPTSRLQYMEWHRLNTIIWLSTNQTATADHLWPAFLKEHQLSVLKDYRGEGGRESGFVFLNPDIVAWQEPNSTSPLVAVLAVNDKSDTFCIGMDMAGKTNCLSTETIRNIFLSSK